LFFARVAKLVEIPHLVAKSLIYND
jgi:hypothetical protein